MAIKKRLGEMLVDAGIIDDSQLHAALRHQRQWGGRLGGILVELKLASEEAIVDALALKFGFEIARLDRIEPYAFEQARALVPHEYAVRNRVFPMAADTGLLVVAMSDPTNLALTDELAFKTGKRVKVCIAGDNAISAAIRTHFGEDASGQREAIALDPDDDSAMEAVYDPIGATSSEQMSHFFEQPAAPQAAPPPAKTAAARPAAAQVAQARSPAAPAAPAAATRATAPSAPPAKSAVVRPTASELEAAAARARSRSPSVLQLEDQPTGSIPLDELQPVEEELQPIPLETEAEAPGEGEPYAAGQEPYTPGPEAYGAGPEAYGADPEPPAAGAEGTVEGAPEQATDAGGYAVAGVEGAEGAYPQREFTEEEVEVLAALDRLAHGDEATPTVVRPAQLVAALIRLMLRKQWITEHELLDEILRG